MLIVGLIILVVLTIIGVQAMRTNIAQERMSVNMRERNVALQAAEAAVRAGERLGPFDSQRDGIGVDPALWNGVDNRTGVLTDFDPGLAEDPAYHVGPPQMMRIGIELPPTFRKIYPVTGRGVGAQEGSVVVVETGFETPN